MGVDVSYSDTRNEYDAKKDSTVAFKSSRKGDKNSYDRDLEERIASVTSEMQEKSEQVEGLESETLTLKTRLEPLLGCKFMHRFFIYFFNLRQ